MKAFILNLDSMLYVVSIKKADNIMSVFTPKFLDEHTHYTEWN